LFVVTYVRVPADEDITCLLPCPAAPATNECILHVLWRKERGDAIVIIIIVIITQLQADTHYTVPRRVEG